MRNEAATKIQLKWKNNRFRRLIPKLIAQNRSKAAVFIQRAFRKHQKRGILKF